MEYLKIFDKMPLPCLLIEPGEDGFFIKDINKAYLELTSWDRNNLLGFSVESILAKSSYGEQVLPAINLAFQSGEESLIECLRYDLFDEKVDAYQEKYWQVKFMPVPEKNTGKTSVILNVVIDKTTEVFKEREKEDISRKLLEKTNICEHFINKNQDALYSMDLHGNFLSINEGVVNMLGLSEKELLKTSFIPFCADYDKERIWAHFQKSVKGENQEFDADFISVKGEKLKLYVSLSPFKMGSQIKGVYGIAKDISEKVLAESEAKIHQEELFKNQRKFKALNQGGTDLIGILDEEANYKFVSDSVHSVLGMRPDEFIGRNAFYSSR